MRSPHEQLFHFGKLRSLLVKMHPEPVTNDDEFELLLSRSKFFKFILVGFVPQFLQTSEIFTFLQK